MVGRDIAAYVAEDQQAGAGRTLLRSRLRETGGPSCTVAGHRRRPGSRSWSSATDIDLEGVLVRCLVLTDLTMQKRVEQQLADEVAQAERQRVAAEVNDTIVQGLVTAEMALDLGAVDYARSADRQHLRAGTALDRRARRGPPGSSRAWPCAAPPPEPSGRRT